MESSLDDLLRNVSFNNTNNELGSKFVATHAILGCNPKQWMVDPSKYNIFWENYLEMTHSNQCKNFLAEVNHYYGPLVMEAHLRFHSEDFTNDVYDDTFVIHIVHYCQEIMKKHLEISHDKKELLCAVLESSDPWIEKDIVHAQLRLHFPLCKVDMTYLMNEIRSDFIKMLRTHNIISMLPMQPIDDWEIIFDKKLFTSPIPMYGSVRDLSENPMTEVMFLSEITSDHLKSSNPPYLNFDDFFVKDQHQHIAIGLLNREIFKVVADDEYWYPLLFSVYYSGHITSVKKKLLNDSANKSFNTDNSVSFTDTYDEYSNMGISDSLIKLISKSRFSHKGDWTEIGKSLYSTFYGQDVGLNRWIKLSKFHESPFLEECKNMYYTFVDNPITVKTIAYYAKKDSKNNYETWHNRWCNDAIIKSLEDNVNHDAVSSVLYRCYWLDFGYYEGKMYKFSGHRWKQMSEMHDLISVVRTDLRSRYEKYRTHLSMEIQNTTDSKLKQIGEITFRKISRLMDNIGSDGWKRSMLNSSKTLFFIEDFRKKLNKNPYLTPFVNGVMDTSLGSINFRDGKPEDFIDKYIPIFFQKNLTWDDPNVKAVLKWFRQMFMDKELIDTVFKLCASLFVAGNQEKIVPFFVGEGDNSKTMFFKLLQVAFGPYCIDFPIEILTVKRSSAGPSPETAQAEAARVALIPEIDEDEGIRGGQFRKLSGNDRYFTRACNENGGSVEMTFTLFISTNKVPTFTNVVKAVIKRYYEIPFSSKWSLAAPDDEDEQFKTRVFKVDPDFDKKIPGLSPYFLWICMNYFDRYKTEGIGKPKIIQEASDEYWSQNDMYKLFINECLTRPIKDTGEVDMQYTVMQRPLYNAFKEWHKDTYPNAKIPNSPQTKSEFCRILGKQKNNRWEGYRIVDTELT